VPVWHASVATLDETGARRVDSYTRAQADRVLGVLDALLGGVGEGQPETESGQRAVHRRRRLTVREADLVHQAATCGGIHA
jgi:hypothetical protein